MTLSSFYPILDTEILSRRGCGVVAAAEAIVQAGARILQLRHKGHYSRELFEQAQCIAGVCRSAGALFVIDDRADIALLLDAALHLGQDDLPPADARRLLGPDRIIGFSTHNAAQLQAAAQEPADYLAVGPIFSTASKENPDPVIGVEALRELRKLSVCPLVAIGGITRENARNVLDASVDSVAVIADLYPEPSNPQTLCERTREWLALLK